MMTVNAADGDLHYHALCGLSSTDTT